MFESVWPLVVAVLFLAGWWLGGAPTEGIGLWFPIGMTWFWFAQYLTQIRHGELLKSIESLERRLLLALEKYDEIPRMERDLETRKRSETK